MQKCGLGNFGNEIYCHLCGDLLQHNKTQDCICIEKKYVAMDFKYPPTCYDCVKNMSIHMMKEEITGVNNVGL